MSAPKCILLVDDNANDLEMTRMALAKQSRSHEVIVAHDGEEALDYLYRRGKFEHRERGNPMVVLLDLKMPKVDGLEVLRQVKSDGQLKRIPVVMLTSSGEVGDVTNCYQLGVNAYVVKPVDFHEFLTAVKGIESFWAEINVPPPNTTITESRNFAAVVAPIAAAS